MQASIKIITAIVALVISVIPSAAWAAGSLTGTWRLMTQNAEETESKAVHKMFGDNPSGIITFTADGWWLFIVADSTRKPPAAPKATDAEAAELWRAMGAAAGRYKTDGDKLTLSVEVGKNPAGTGTERTGSVEVKDDRFQYKSPPFIHPDIGKEVVETWVWERVK